MHESSISAGCFSWFLYKFLIFYADVVSKQNLLCKSVLSPSIPVSVAVVWQLYQRKIIKSMTMFSRPCLTGYEQNGYCLHLH